MKLEVLSNNFPPEILGGAEICAHNLSEELSRHTDIDLFVFAGKYNLSHRHSSYKIEECVNNYRIYRINLGSSALDFRNPMNFYNPFIEEKYISIFKKERPDLLHAHNLAGLSMGPVAYSKKRFNIPIVMTLHDFWLICPKNTLLTKKGELCERGGESGCDGCNAYLLTPFSNISMTIRNKIIRKLSDNIDLFISPSEKLKEIMEDKGYGFKIEHIENGLYLNPYLSIKNKEKYNKRFSILMLSYLSYHKGVYILIEAIKKLVDKGYSEIDLILAGAAENEIKLRDFIHKTGLKSHISLLGKVSEAEKLQLFERSDVFVLPSLWYENQPLTIIEAMASNLPVVATDIGGIPEMVQDGRTGYLFERGDSIDLAMKIEDLILNRNRCIGFGSAGRDRAMYHYDISKNAEKTLKIYEGIL